MIHVLAVAAKSINSAMENKESIKSKFTPDCWFLEDPRILRLENLVFATYSSFTKIEDRPKALADLEEEWDKVQKECIEKVDNDSTDIKLFLCFVLYNRRKM